VSWSKVIFHYKYCY